MEDSVWLKDQVPKIIAQVLRSVKAAQEAGIPVQPPDFIYFEVEYGRIKINFDVRMVNEPGNNGRTTAEPNATYVIMGADYASMEDDKKK